MVLIKVYKNKDEKDSLPDPQIFMIGSKVYEISQKLNMPLTSFLVVGFLYTLNECTL